MPTTIPTLPPAPSRANDTPEQFSNKADALLGALSGFVTAANAQAGENNTAASNAAASAASAGTSASSATASASSATASQTAAAISASAAESFAQQASGTAISSGTANAVAYLDANKYLKATSDLTYNGSQLGVPAGTVSNPSLTTTGDTNTGLYFPAADTVGVAAGGAQVAQFSPSGLAINGNNISAVNSLGFRNRIINGDMRIDQRNAGASINPTDGQFVVDRFAIGVSQTSKLTAQRSTVAPAGFTNSILVTSSSAYSVLTADYFAVNQSIEGLNVADFGWGTANAQTLTLSFLVRSSLTGTFAGSIRNSASNRSYPYTYTISAANTWEQKTVTIAGDTAGTWLTDNGAGIRVWFTLGAGSTYSGTAGAWSAGNFFSATGATSVVGTNGATFYITGVQLEAGTVATPFERRPYGTELALCQRYYQTVGANMQFFGQVHANGNTTCVSWPLGIAMRSAPTVTGIYNVAPSRGAAFWIAGGTSITADSATTTFISFQVSNGGTRTGGAAANIADSTFNLSSEL